MEQHFNRIHNNIEQLIPTYVQSLSNLQQEYLSVWKNMMCSSLSMQEQYAQKIGMENSISKAPEMIENVLEEIERGFRIHSYFVQTWLDVSKHSIQGFNENYTAFVEENKKIIKSLTDRWDLNR